MCFAIIFRYVPWKAVRYAGSNTLAAILFPVNVILIEQCISCMESRLYPRFWLVLLLFILCSFFLVWIEHRRRVIDSEFVQELTNKCIPEVINKMNRMRYSYFDDAKSADILSRLTGDPAVAIAGVYKKLIDCAALLIRLYGVALIYFRLSVIVGLTLFLFLSIQIYIGILSQREVVKLYETETQDERRLQYLGGLLCDKNSVFDLKVNQAVSRVERLQKEKAREVLKIRVKISVKAEKYYMLNLLLMLTWTVILLLFGVMRIADKSITLGLFVTLMGNYPVLTGYQNTLSYYLSSMSGEFLVCKSLMQLWDYEEECGNCGIENGDFHLIEFQHVSFRYPSTEEWVLKDVSFQVGSNETLALVGENGSGKSTIIKLLCGLYQPDEGEILIDGKRIDQLLPESRRQLISVVFQDYEKYSLTAGENVGLGNSANIYNSEKIRKAAKCAGAETILDELPKGLQTNLNHLEEDGVLLSGGQWQRLAIARAYMAESAFFLLDEPTASMDPRAESQMYQNIAAILKGKGVVLVSHRLPSAIMADRILVLDKGTLAQSGTHEDLMQEEGIYKKMFECQTSWYCAS